VASSGTLLNSKGGLTFSPSHVYMDGMDAVCSNSGLVICMTSFVGTGASSVAPQAKRKIKAIGRIFIIFI
jgi:hypothetical protein